MDRDLLPGTRDAIREALRRRRKIEAIKLYREATGLGLAESKEAVEEMERNLVPAGSGAGSSSSEASSPLSPRDLFGERRKSGCFGVCMLLAVIVATAAWSWLSPDLGLGLFL